MLEVPGSRRSNAIELMRKNGLNIWKETRGVLRKGPTCKSKGASEIGDFEDDRDVEVEKADEPGKGLGVQIRENVKMGTFVGEYYGEVVSSGEALRRTGEYVKDVEVEK